MTLTSGTHKASCTHLLLDVSYEVSRLLAFQFQRRRFLKVFTIYGHGGHLSQVTMTI